MIQLIGILIIVNTLVLSAWWLTAKQSWSTGFTTVSVLACLIGLALVLNERALELSFGKFGKIKAAAQQAETDAKEIAQIRKRVEAQAATMDLVAKESAEAKRLLADLSKQNQIAEQKLKELGERTSEVVRLPDGRTKFGNIITGVPSTLQKEFDAGLAAYRQNDLPTALAAFSKCIEMHEKSKKQEGNVAMISGRVNPAAIATIYAYAADAALRSDKTDLAVPWAQLSVDTVPSPERKALLVACLIKNQKMKEAQELIDKTLKEQNNDSKRFRDVLIEWGFLSKQPNN